MNTPTHDEINRVLDDLLFRLLERWPNDYVSLVRCRGQHDGRLTWHANTTSQGVGKAETTAEAAVNNMLYRNASVLLQRRDALREELENVTAELAALTGKEGQA